MQFNKLCAVHLRTISKNHGIKLKSSHAHELIAAFFGYKSKAALYADTQYPIVNLSYASVIVQVSSAQIDLRRKNLEGLPSELPDSDTLTKVVFDYLKSEGLISSKIWQYNELKKHAKLLSHEYQNQKQLNQIYLPPNLEEVIIQTSDEEIVLTVIPYHQPVSSSDFKRDQMMQLKNISTSLSTTIRLKRIAGYIGYAEPEISVHSIPMIHLTQS